jgi:hypothetical protein
MTTTGSEANKRSVGPHLRGLASVRGSDLCGDSSGTAMNGRLHVTSRDEVSARRMRAADYKTEALHGRGL